jgi:hypothetical protein
MFTKEGDNCKQKYGQCLERHPMTDGLLSPSSLQSLRSFEGLKTPAERSEAECFSLRYRRKLFIQYRMNIREKIDYWRTMVM